MERVIILSYDVEELFGFRKIDGGYAVRYLNENDPEITEVEIPAEYDGAPVTRIAAYGFFNSANIKRVVIPPSVRVIDAAAFAKCYNLETAELPEGLEEIRSIAFEDTNLKSVVLPKSLTRIFSEAFKFCEKLESVTFNSRPSLGEKVFFCSFELPADITLMGLVNSLDLSKPLDADAFNNAFDDKASKTGWRYERLKYTRPDVFELAAKNDCFRSVDVSVVLKALIKKDDAKSLHIAEEYDVFKTRDIVDECVKYSAELGKTEITAYLLELKSRKFGFKGGDDLAI